MRAFLLSLFAILAFSSDSFALERKTIVIKADTDYKQVVWTAVGLNRVYSANVLPANPQVASVLSRLNPRTTYRCEAEYYLGSIGYFNRDGERSVMMLYSVLGCQVQN